MSNLLALDRLILAIILWPFYVIYYFFMGLFAKNIYKIFFIFIHSDFVLLAKKPTHIITMFWRIPYMLIDFYFCAPFACACTRCTQLLKEQY